MTPDRAASRRSASDAALLEVLERSRALGFLGPGPVIDHISHARRLLESVPATSGFFVDLGSGGGVPGLVLAVDRPDWDGALLDGSTRRGAFLDEALVDLDLSDRIEVWTDRAETVGRDALRRGRADVVTARSFGPPAVVAECAAPLLSPGGRLIVSDPPSDHEHGDRWPDADLAPLGLRVVRKRPGPPACTVLEQFAPCPDRFPRRIGIPAKRPLF